MNKVFPSLFCGESRKFAETAFDFNKSIDYTRHRFFVCPEFIWIYLSKTDIACRKIVFSFFHRI